MEDVSRGDLGHREWSIAVIERGHCPCADCGGHLVDRTCSSCGCQHWVSEPTEHVRQRYACMIPVYDLTRCAEAAAIDATYRRERERERRRPAGE